MFIYPFELVNLAARALFLVICQRCWNNLQVIFDGLALEWINIPAQTSEEYIQSLTLNVLVASFTRVHMNNNCHFAVSLLLVFFCLFVGPSRKIFHWRWSLILLMFPGKHWNKYHPWVRQVILHFLCTDTVQFNNCCCTSGKRVG